MWHTTLWRRLDGRWLVALIALEVVACLVLFVPRGEVGSAGAGIGEYAASLASGHGYAMPVPCGQLDHARRMPLAPVFLAAIALVGGGVWTALLVRLVLLLGVLVAAIASHAREGERWWQSSLAKLLLALLAASPLFAKHLAQLGYEEGFSIVLVPALVLVGLAVVQAPEAREARVDLGFGALVAAVYLVKSGHAPLCLVGCAALGWAALARRRRSAWLGLSLALAAPLGWMLFVLATTGRIDAGTSWDGENLFRGWCAPCARVYPWQSLDRLFDTAAIATPDGVVPAPPAPSRCAFPSEWAWSDHYRARALSFARAAPREAFGYLLRKLGVVLFEVRPVPRVGGLDVTRSAVVVGSFVLLRGAALGVVFLAWRRRTIGAHFTASLCFSAACCVAVCVPLLVGFAYDRHSIVLLVTVLVAAAGVANRAPGTNGRSVSRSKKSEDFRSGRL